MLSDSIKDVGNVYYWPYFRQDFISQWQTFGRDDQRIHHLQAAGRLSPL
jgi:hypothetical protein